MILRGGVFFGLLALLLLAEHFWPRRVRSMNLTPRWLTNFSIAVINLAAVRLLGPLTAVAAAGLAATNGWGILRHIDLPVWAEIIAVCILLDLAVYGQHVVTHKIPLLWRLHRVHHADRDFDTSTALRFHPIEIVLSMLYKSLLVLAIGPSILAVIVFEAVLNGSAMFNHSNLKLPLGIDRILRSVIVTPDMHRVHHSVVPSETNSNYGFFLPWWDWVFGTYKSQPDAGHKDMTIGLSDYQSAEPVKLLWSLKLPFRNS